MDKKLTTSMKSKLTDEDRENRIHELYRERIKQAAAIFEASVRREYEIEDPEMLGYIPDLIPSDVDLDEELLNSPAGELLTYFADWMNASPDDFMKQAEKIAEAIRSKQVNSGAKPKWWTKIIYKEAQRLRPTAYLCYLEAVIFTHLFLNPFHCLPAGTGFDSHQLVT